MLERLDREQLITLLIAAFERNTFLEKKIIEHTDRIVELENRLKQNSSNSSKPPSSDGYSKPVPKSERKKSRKKSGGQYGHPGHGMSMADKVTETKVITPEVCSGCEESLIHVMGHKIDKHYMMEIPPIKVTITVHMTKKKRSARHAEGR